MRIIIFMLSLLLSVLKVEAQTAIIKNLGYTNQERNKAYLEGDYAQLRFRMVGYLKKDLE